MTQRDLMAKFSVSQATVSMALNDNPAISLKLRRAIQRAADEMGYRPNLAGQMLRKAKSNLLGVLLPSLHYSFYAELLAELHLCAQRRGYVILLEHCEDRESFVAAMRNIERFNAAGVMAVCAPDWGMDLLGGKMPAVLLQGRPLPESLADKVSQVCPDMYQCGHDLAAHLLDSGRKHPVYLGTVDEREPRFQGFAARCAAAGITDVPTVSGGENDTDAGYRLMPEALKRHPRTDAVAVHNDNMAIGALRWLWEQRIAVPGRIAVAGFDNIREDAYTTPALTSIGPDRRNFAEQALTELLAAIAEPGRHRTVKVRCELKVRESA